MEKEGSCDTGLSLSLGNFKPGNPSRRSPIRPPEPSLTLTLLEEIHGFTAKETRRLSSPHSTISSFSTNIVKREKLDVATGEEGEVERGSSSRGSEEDDDVFAAAAARKKLRLSKEQSALLEDRFKEHSTLNPKQKQALAKQLNLRPRQIEVWFQNRRARTKLKQTEVDCELLRRCCESLTEENRRLKKELHEVKTFKFARAPSAMPPLFMHLPATTLTLCPSCERIAGADGVNKPPPPPQHFYNPFPRSAAC